MKTYNAYLIDLDGTMYLGNEPIEAAADFVEKLSERGIPYLFLTNNSTKTQAQVSEKLQQMAVPSTPEQIFTTSMATSAFIKQRKEHARCLVVGEEGLRTALRKEGHIITDEDCDFVVVGLDRGVTYEKLSKACLAVRNGATFISTNADVALPTERGLEAGNGALTSVVTVSTGQQPIFIGKPESIMMEQAILKLGTDKADALMVGDNYDTDILAGINAGIDTLMTFTGVTPFSDYPNFEQKPTYYVHSLREWINYIESV